MTTWIEVILPPGLLTASDPRIVNKTILKVKREGLGFDILKFNSFHFIAPPGDREVNYRRPAGSLGFLNAAGPGGAKIYILYR